MSQKAPAISITKLSNKKFWILACLIALVLISLMSYRINRQFTGLHSWGEASIAWRSKVLLKYDISYTKLLSTWAVGEPPEATPRHYLDHPQLGMMLRALDMVVFGINEWAQRAGGIIRAVICLFLFLIILRGLTDDKTSLIAGLLYALFPLTCFFGPRDWTFPLSFAVIWFYLIVIGAFNNGPAPKKRHYIGLALTLFFVMQMTWSGFFYAMAIGIHYVCRCINKRKKPSYTILAILTITPLISMAINFTVMLWGNNWQLDNIIQLYQWRAGKGEMESFQWGKWFARMWEFAVMNFSLAVLIMSIAYLTIGQLYVLRAPAKKAKQIFVSRRFPQFWLFMMPAIFQLFLLKGTLWMHHYWERPLVPVIAISAALFIVVVGDIFAKANKTVSHIATCVLIIVAAILCGKGLEHYHGIRHFSSARANMYSDLQKQLTPDQTLLSFETLVVEQHKVKGSFYRPEVAWYLDRHVKQVTTFQDVVKLAETGKYPRYIMPAAYYNQQMSNHLRTLGKQLSQLYKFKYVATVKNEPGLPYLVFDLTNKLPQKQQ